MSKYCSRLLKTIFKSHRFLRVDSREPSFEKVDIENFLVKTNYDRTIINKKEPQSPELATQDPKAFMATIEKDANRRAAERKQREIVAQDLRK
jgi:hypothetical protein